MSRFTIQKKIIFNRWLTTWTKQAAKQQFSFAHSVASLSSRTRSAAFWTPMAWLKRNCANRLVTWTATRKWDPEPTKFSQRHFSSCSTWMAVCTVDVSEHFFVKFAWTLTLAWCPRFGRQPDEVAGEWNIDQTYGASRHGTKPSDHQPERTTVQPVVLPPSGNSKPLKRQNGPNFDCQVKTRWDRFVSKQSRSGPSDSEIVELFCVN